MSDSISIEIDGQAYEARRGEMIIQVADRNGVHIPRFCYHKKLSVAANCRMCLVEVERAPKPLPACATPVGDGMKISTASPFARRAQKSVMEFLLINHPLDCPICDQGGECELQDVAMGYGRDVSRYVERKRVVADKNLGPLIATDMTRCIHCTRCVRFGAEIAGMPELGMTGRGENARIGTFVEKSVESELSGNAIDVCPVGALTNKPFRFSARTWELQQRPSVAPHDGVGSNLSVHIARNKVLRVVPRANEAVNEVWLSDRDRFSYAGLYSEERLLSPMVKRDGQWEEADWESALRAAARSLRAQAERSPAQLGALLSPSLTLEELYLSQKLVRGLGSDNVDHRLRQQDFSDSAGWPGAPGLSFDLAELERQSAILVVGANTRKEVPLLNHRLRKAALAGASIFTLTAAQHELNYPAAGCLVARPDAWAAEMAGIAKACGSKHAAVARLKPSDGQKVVGGALREASSAVVLLGAGVLNHPNGAALRRLAQEIADAAGARLGLIVDGANGRGAWLVGAVPHRSAGGAALEKPGLDAGQMLASAARGAHDGVRALLLVGCEPELDCADSAQALAAMRSVECLVALTAFKSERLLEHADVLLPISPFAETAGTFVNLSGAVQRTDACVPPSGDSRPAWKVLRVLGNLLELDGFEFTQLVQVQAEIDALGSAQRDSAWSDVGSLPSASQAPFRLGDMPMYAADSLVRRAEPLQETIDARFRGAELSVGLAERLGIRDGDTVSIRQGGEARQFTAAVVAELADGCVRLPVGLRMTEGLGVAYGAVELTRAG